MKIDLTRGRLARRPVEKFSARSSLWRRPRRPERITTWPRGIVIVTWRLLHLYLALPSITLVCSLVSIRACLHDLQPWWKFHWIFFLSHPHQPTSPRGFSVWFEEWWFFETLCWLVDCRVTAKLKFHYCIWLCMIPIRDKNLWLTHNLKFLFLTYNYHNYAALTWIKKYKSWEHLNKFSF